MWREAAKALQALVHGVMNLPPSGVCDITGIDVLVTDIPIAVVVPVTMPGLPPKEMYGIELGRVSAKQLVLHASLGRCIIPEVL
uniref:Uncharacterized protein n=1 Tax=Nelumbo nucifera TaxID=4432 RepID=A0A822Z9Q1_NELNU|nr:TPA_asm: hypothetical protein HUJ06_015632 [Nelumbo nucifera]